MLNGVDISNWQGDMQLSDIWSYTDFIICKATEGTGFVDSTCDPWIQQCIQGGKLFGFYHFAGNRGAISEAEYFVNNCEGYFGKGVPVLDWEGDQSVAWVNTFVRTVHEKTGIWPWIYANPWRFNQGGVEPNCMRWVASYPDVESPTFDDAGGWDCPNADGLVGCWQFCSDGRLDGYSGNLDLNLFYGDESSWLAYVGNGDSGDNGVCIGVTDGDNDNVRLSVLENDRFRVTVEVK